MFHQDQERVRSIYSHLATQQSVTLPFEDRFVVLNLKYPIEKLESGDPCPPGEFFYCLFVNHRGIRHLEVNARQAEIAVKIKAQLPLNLAEKAEALHILRALAR